MKVGQEVAVCYDGKYGRRVKGVVIKQHNGHHITVRFEPWAGDDDNKPVEVKFRRGHNNRHWEGYHKEVECSIHRSLCGLPGDYYSIKGRWIENWTYRRDVKTERWFYKRIHQVD